LHDPTRRDVGTQPEQTGESWVTYSLRQGRNVVHSMRTHHIPPALAKATRLGVFVILLSCIGFAGCENFCVVGVSNPGGGGGTVGVGTTCPVPNQTGNVTLQLNSSVTPTAPSWPSDVQHIFVSVRGIEALPADPSGEDLPAWQELTPDLATQPAQVDLMARATSACGRSVFPEARVSTGVYTQLRVRLVPNQPDASEPVPAENACGKVGFNCIVASSGAIRLLTSDDPTELRIPANGIADGFFRVVPDDHIRLAIEFDPLSSLILRSGDAAQLLPTFSVTRQSSCESDSE
jgi:hypothetical protein